MKTQLGEREFERVVTEQRLLLQSMHKCKNCGNCCAISNPVIVTCEDVQRLAKRFKIPYAKALKKYTIPLPGGGRSLKHLSPCKFLDSRTKHCKIYEDRPAVCRKYPFFAATPALVIPTECPACLEVYKTYKNNIEKATASPLAERLRTLFDQSPPLREAFRVLLAIAMAVRVGELSYDQAVSKLTDYQDRRALTLAAAVGNSIMDAPEVSMACSP